MIKKIKKLLKKHSGTTFVELLLYTTILLVLMPILLNISIYSMRTEEQHNLEKQISDNSRFIVERIYDLIVSAKKVDMVNSEFDNLEGKLTLIMEDDSQVSVEFLPEDKMVEITENGVTSKLSSGDDKVESLYFEKITDNINDPDIVLGINIRFKVSGASQYSIIQDYVVSANLEKGDYDEDGCPDFMDKYPKHPECCGDEDDDGVCNKMDNCVMSYNPFQEDYDTDGIGDECDSSIFTEGGGSSGGSSAYNCSADDQLLALINQEPPLSSPQLKQILLSSSPLPPSVLMALIDAHPLLTNGHFRQVFVANTKLPEGILEEVIEMDLPFFTRIIIVGADAIAEYIPWLGIDKNNTSNYEVTLSTDAEEGEEWINKITFHDSDSPLGTDGMEKTDIFTIDVTNGSTTVIVTTESDGSTEENIITEEENYLIDDFGFAIELDNIIGNSYIITVSSIQNDNPLDSVMFDFGEGATITNPTGTYEAPRYICYCEGGCAENCEDIGTGIITSNVHTDRCYQWNYFFPEWCSRWDTFEDDDSTNPAYIGGTQIDEGNVYWEKTFKTILTQTQLQNLQSITVGGEIAYQRLGQFFCDTLESSCPMSGDLIGAQDVELYNWDEENWEVVGVSNLDGEISDQQKFEVIYNNTEDVLKYVGGDGNDKIMARMQFNWEGIEEEGETSAPCFMLIDYFTLHLRW